MSEKDGSITNTVCDLHTRKSQVRKKERITMASAGASQFIPRGVFEGSISGHDKRVERRPYHKNCDCALHNLKKGICNKACPQQRLYVPFTKKTTPWNGCSINTTPSKFSSQSPLSPKPDLTNMALSRKP